MFDASGASLLDASCGSRVFDWNFGIIRLLN